MVSCGAKAGMACGLGCLIMRPETTRQAAETVRSEMLCAVALLAEEETIMKQLVGRFGILAGVLVAFSLLTLTPGLGVSDTAAQDGAAVTIVDFAFQPASLEVPAGTTVTWTNSGAATHTVTADNGAFDSGRLASGATFSQTFDTAGTFTYHCEIHPQMTGTIVVTEASGAQPAALGQATQQPQASNQAQANNQAQAPKVAQMPKTGVGTMALAGRNTELVL